MMQQETGETSEAAHGYENHRANATGWADMLPEVLVNIFTLLDLKDAMNVYAVCRKWAQAVGFVWKNLDLDVYCLDYGEKLEAMASLLVKRARGVISQFRVPLLTSADMLLDDSTSAVDLKELHLPHNFLDSRALCEIAGKFSSIMYLDLTGSPYLSRTSLDIFGKNCNLLKRLNLSKFPPEAPKRCPSDRDRADDLAYSIAKNMPQLEHLEMSHGSISNVGLKALLENCSSLKHLDLRGCRNVDMEDNYLKEAIKRLESFHPPIVVDAFDSDYEYELDFMTDAEDVSDDHDVYEISDDESNGSDIYVDDDPCTDEDVPCIW